MVSGWIGKFPGYNTTFERTTLELHLHLQTYLRGLLLGGLKK